VNQCVGSAVVAETEMPGNASGVCVVGGGRRRQGCGRRRWWCGAGCQCGAKRGVTTYRRRHVWCSRTARPAMRVIGRQYSGSVDGGRFDAADGVVAVARRGAAAAASSLRRPVTQQHEAMLASGMRYQICVLFIQQRQMSGVIGRCYAITMPAVTVVAAASDMRSAC